MNSETVITFGIQEKYSRLHLEHAGFQNFFASLLNGNKKMINHC